MRFFLLTDEYDSLHGSRETGYETQARELSAETFDSAMLEARLLFVELPRYFHKSWSGDQHDEFPCNPRLITKLEDV